MAKTQIENSKKQCEHKQTKETGYREKHVHCLDCDALVRSYWPMST